MHTPSPPAHRRALRRLAAVLATATGALLALALASPAMAMTMSRPHYGPAVPPAPVPATTVRVVTAGGMAGWQVTLIAIGAALTAAVMFIDRGRAARRATPAPTA